MVLLIRAASTKLGYKFRKLLYLAIDHHRHSTEEFGIVLPLGCDRGGARRRRDRDRDARLVQMRGERRRTGKFRAGRISLLERRFPAGGHLALGQPAIDPESGDGPHLVGRSVGRLGCGVMPERVAGDS